MKLFFNRIELTEEERDRNGKRRNCMEEEFFFFFFFWGWNIDSLKFCKFIAFLVLILKLVFKLHNGVKIVMLCFREITRTENLREFVFLISFFYNQITIIFFYNPYNTVKITVHDDFIIACYVNIVRCEKRKCSAGRGGVYF